MALAALSTIANDVYIGGNFYMMWWLAGDALMKCGYVIADHASNDAEVIINPVTPGCPFGVTALQVDVDIDTLLTDGTTYAFYALHAGTVLWIGHDTTAQAMKLGEYLQSSTAVAGTGMSGSDADEVIGRILETEDTAADEWMRTITKVA